MRPAEPHAQGVSNDRSPCNPRTINLSTTGMASKSSLQATDTAGSEHPMGTLSGLGQSQHRARWAAKRSKQETPGPNKRLSEDEELAVCLYLDRSEHIGTLARMQMITWCADDILHRGFTPAPVRILSPPRWTGRFPGRHPEYTIWKRRSI